MKLYSILVVFSVTSLSGMALPTPFLSDVASALSESLIGTGLGPVFERVGQNVGQGVGATVGKALGNEIKENTVQYIGEEGANAVVVAADKIGGVVGKGAGGVVGKGLARAIGIKKRDGTDGAQEQANAEYAK